MTTKKPMFLYFSLDNNHDESKEIFAEPEKLKENPIYQGKSAPTPESIQSSVYLSIGGVLVLVTSFALYKQYFNNFKKQ